MHNRDKHPEIWASFERAKAREAELMAERKTFTDQIDAQQPAIDKLEADKAGLNRQAMANAPEIREVRGDIARMALAMGGNKLSE